MQDNRPKQLPFTLLKIDNSIWSFETMSGAVDATDTSDGVALRVLRVRLAHCIEVRTTGVDLSAEVSDNE